MGGFGWNARESNGRFHGDTVSDDRWFMGMGLIHVRFTQHRIDQVMKQSSERLWFDCHCDFHSSFSMPVDQLFGLFEYAGFFKELFRDKDSLRVGNACLTAEGSEQACGVCFFE